MSSEHPSADPALTPAATPETAASVPSSPGVAGGGSSGGGEGGGGAPGEGLPAVKKPNMAGLPPIAKPTLVRSNEDGPRPSRPSFKDRPRREDVARPTGEKVPDTRSTLMKVSDESAPGLDADIAAQVDAAIAGGAMPAEKPVAHPGKPVIKHTAGEPARIRGPRVVESGREKRHGAVVSVGPTDVFIEFGPKDLGVVSRTQWKEGEELPAVGSTIEVVVDKVDPNDGLVLCSRPGAIQKADWENLSVGQVIEARVTGVNKGGLELEVAGHKAFMPAGQVSLDRIEDLSVFVGEKLTCQVAQLDMRGRGNIVLSRKDLLRAERAEKGKKLKETLAEGQTVEGVVRKVMAFGAFVDLGGLDGLLHVSDLTYDRVFPGEKNVEKYVKVGDKVAVKILKLDIENDKISLGMKQLASDPFAVAVGSLTEGVTVTGRVVRMTEFGAFIEISPGVDGLVHISEIARRRINKPEDVLKQDEVVTAKVLKIDPETRRVSLSIKALEPVAERAAPDPNDKRAVARAERDKRDQERLAEIQKESPELRRQREKFRNKQLSGGFGEKFGFLGGGLGDLKLGK